MYTMDGQVFSLSVHVHIPRVLSFELSGTPGTGFEDSLNN